MTMLITQGDALTLPLKAVKEDGTPLVLSGASIVTKFQHKTSGFVTISSATITNAALGEYSVVLSAADTGNLKAAPGRSFFSVVTIESQILHVWFDNALDVREATL